MDIKKISTGKNPENGEVNVFIEIPQGSDVKYELDKESGVIFVDRFLYTAMNYPTNYGFAPNTLSKDGDPIDVMVLSSKPAYPGTVLPSVIVGMLEMEDEAGIDTKILAVPTKKIDPVFGEYKDITDVPDAIKNKIKHFFDHMKELEPGKWVKTKDWKGKKEAVKEFQASITK